MSKWKKHEIEFLRNNYRQISYIDVSKKIDRSLKSIYWKAYDLNLKKGRWDENNRLNKDKIIKLLIEQKIRLGKSPSVRETPIALRSACQRHFGNFNNAKKAANLDTKDYINYLPKRSYKPSKELAYIVGLLLGDGSFRYQKSRERTSYVIVFVTKDKDLMDFFLEKFERWSSYKPKKISVKEGGYKLFPSGVYSYYKKTYGVQISFRDAWKFLEKFKSNLDLCLKFFPITYQNWLLKGLWDAEGCIRTRNRLSNIHFSNSNKGIIELYTNILKNFNFTYSIYKTNTGFNIDISNQYEIRRFIKIIKGITIKRKRNKVIPMKLNNTDVKGISFNDRVYELVKKIPYGRVSTYGCISHALGCKAYRAVGVALNRNPYAPKVPCHRIVNSNGSIGGFASGAKNKIKLLKKEHVRVKNNRIVDFDKILVKLRKPI